MYDPSMADLPFAVIDEDMSKQASYERLKRWVQQPNIEVRRMFKRAGGDCICDQCGKCYYDHPFDTKQLSYDDKPFLHVLCNGDRVKL